MTIETYYNFVKIIECGNILAASQELMIAQPALSTQLKNLENNLGVRLVERGAKKISLTPAGRFSIKRHRQSAPWILPCMRNYRTICMVLKVRLNYP